MTVFSTHDARSFFKTKPLVSRGNPGQQNAQPDLQQNILASNRVHHAQSLFRRVESRKRFALVLHFQTAVPLFFS